MSTDADIRDASSEAEGTIGEYLVDSKMRVDVFAVKLLTVERLRLDGSWDKLTSEEQRLVDKMVCPCCKTAPMMILTRRPDARG